jgi:hypothetical protein
MRYRRDYQETHDIDWFFRYKGKVYHAASNGGLLPDKVDSLKNRTLQEKLEEMPGMYEVEMVQNLARQDEDLSSFREYAAKGFISLDRKENDGEKLSYERIAFPVNDQMFSNEDLLKLMPSLNDNEIEIDE